MKDLNGATRRPRQLAPLGETHLLVRDEGKGLSQSLYDEAVAVLTQRGLVEIISLCGNYTLVAMTLNAFEFSLPDGEISDLNDDAS